MNNKEKFAAFIRERIKDIPDVAVVLGSGLGDLSSEIEEPVIIPYGEIPDYPLSNVKGHNGRVVYGKHSGKKVICEDGRLHYYEGHSMEKVVLPIRLFGALGIKNLILSNASGGVNRDFKAGDLMIIRDHLNFTGINPLVGENDDSIGPRFPDLGDAYCEELRNLAKRAAQRLEIDYREGVYAFLTGPSYETPAEVSAIRIMGGDAVGMSTVPEVIVAVHQGMRVLGISSISNLAADLSKTPITHDMVLKVADSVKAKFVPLVKEIIREI